MTQEEARQWTPAVENEWLRCAEGTVYQVSCCDCALVHDIEFRVVDGAAEYRVKRNEPATEAKRTGEGPFWKHMAEEYLETAKAQAESKNNAIAEIARLTREREEAESDTCQCFWCYAVFPYPKSGTVLEQADALTAHTMECHEHPMHKLVAAKSALAAARERIAELEQK
jgi:hypothetical protein